MNRHPALMPVRNNIDMTKKAVKTVLAQDVPVSLLLIDNDSTDGMSEFFHSRDDMGYVYFNPPRSVSASWNYGLQFFFSHGYDHVLVVNNDIELRPETYRRLLEDGGPFVTAIGVREWPEGEASLKKRLHPDFSCFLIRKELYEKIGPFDEKFLIAYCEDGDYDLRMSKAGIRACCIDIPFLHPRSGTIKNATPAEVLKIQMQAERNREYFKKKWGFAMGSEEYYRVLDKGEAPD